MAVGTELLEVGPQIGDFLVVLDPGENHFGAGYLGSRILDVILERILAPGDPRILVGLGISIALDGAGLAALEPVEHRADLVLGIFADRMARQAFPERLLARCDILGQCTAGRSGEHRRNKYQCPCHDGSFERVSGGKPDRRTTACCPPAIWMAGSSEAVNRQSDEYVPMKNIPQESSGTI